MKLFSLSLLLFSGTMGIFGTQSANAATLFRAELSGDQVVSSPTPDTTATGLVTFSLNEDETELSYQLSLDGVNLKRNIARRTRPADVTKIHIHTAAPGVNGPHVLNIFGLPAEDDADAKFRYGKNTISGVWDDSDVSDLNGNGIADPNDSKPLSAFVDELLAGNLYVQVHTNRFDSADGFPGELRGQVLAARDSADVPEPTAIAGLITLGLGAQILRKRTQNLT